jgi:hypothetical protein
VTPNNKSYPLRDGQCKTLSTFKSQATLEQLEKDGYNTDQCSFTFVNSVSEDGLRLLGNGPKLLCPNKFDPKGQKRQHLGSCKGTIA